MNTVAKSLSEPGDLDETLRHITRSALANIPHADYVSISIRRGHEKIETLAPTGELADQLDALQYELREGPCYDAVTDEIVACSTDLSSDPRWPYFGPKASAAGVASQMAVVLYSDTKTRIGLNFYSHELAAFEQRDELVLLFAFHARVALGYAREVGDLSAAVSSRQVIGEAIGIIRERYGMTDQRAFEFLVRVSQTSNVKLREVARQIVDMPPGAAVAGRTSERTAGSPPGGPR